LTTTAKVISVAVTAPSGTGYTTAPTVGFTGGTGTAATATATIQVNAVTLNYGGGGFPSSATATIADSNGGTGSGATATIVVSQGTVMTPGTSPTNLSVVGTAGVQTSPISEIFTNAKTDLLFYGYSGAIVAQNVTGGTISTTTTAAYSPSGIVVDNISTQNQASSIYFATQAKQSFTGSQTVNIASVTSPGALFSNSTATVTTQTPNNFATGNSVTIAGVSCPSGSCGSWPLPDYNGTWTITVTNPTTFTFTVCSTCFGATATPDTGTATGPPVVTQAYGAIKLTQSGLN
jgi:hypothetical protein